MSSSLSHSMGLFLIFDKIITHALNHDNLHVNSTFTKPHVIYRYTPGQGDQPLIYRRSVKPGHSTFAMKTTSQLKVPQQGQLRKRYSEHYPLLHGVNFKKELPFSNILYLPSFIITDRVRSTTGGNVFRGITPSPSHNISIPQYFHGSHVLSWGIAQWLVPGPFRGVPQSQMGGYPSLIMGYPLGQRWGTPQQGWGTPPSGQFKMGYPLDPARDGVPPDRTADGVLDTPRSVCLLWFPAGGLSC